MSKTEEQRIRENIFDSTSGVRRKIAITLAVLILISTVSIIYCPTEFRSCVTDLTQLTASTAAALISVIVVYRQKTDGLIGKAFTFLAAGFVLYLIAEAFRSYIEIGVGIENQFLSISYVLWFSGYISFFYFLSKMYQLLWASHSRRHQIFVSTACGTFLVSFMVFISNASDLKAQEGLIPYLVTSAFLVLDITLLVPAALILLNPRKGPLTPIPWIFSAILLLTVGDSVLAYTSNVTVMYDFVWISNLFFIVAYLSAAAGLFWHHRFFILHQRKKTHEIQAGKSTS